MLAKRIALGFGIAIVFPMMIHFMVTSFSPKPKWKDYQIEDYFEKHKRASFEEQRKLEEEKRLLQKKKDEAEKRYQKHMFFVAVPAGIIAILVGAFISSPAMGAGLMFGGLFSACDGYYHYWSELADVLKFASMLVLFVVLLVIGYKKLERRN